MNVTHHFNHDSKMSIQLGQLKRGEEILQQEMTPNPKMIGT